MVKTILQFKCKCTLAWKSRYLSWLLFFGLVLLVKTKIFRSHHTRFDDLVQDWVGTAILGFVLHLGNFQPHFYWPFISWDCYTKLHWGVALAQVLKPLHPNLTKDNEWTHKNKWRRYRSQRAMVLRLNSFARYCENIQGLRVKMTLFSTCPYQISVWHIKKLERARKSNKNMRDMSLKVGCSMNRAVMYSIPKSLLLSW